MNVDTIIVGQGIGGTLISWELHKRGISHVVVDNHHFQSASKIAAGVINPITGRKYVKSWRIEQFLPIAKNTYVELANHLKIVTHNDHLIYRGLYSIEDENTWESRKSDPVAGQYISNVTNDTVYEKAINGVMAYGVLVGGMQVKLDKITEAYRSFLKEKNMLVNEKFECDHLQNLDSKVKYRDIHANRVIFAEGYHAQNNPYWSYLPFEPAKGDVLIIKLKGEVFEHILRHKVFITPIGDDLYWVGSDYRWKFDDDRPSAEKRVEMVAVLDKILNVPYEIVEHKAGIRPCVKSRRPFLGRHPMFDKLVLFNGLGTKGASLGPFWARHLIDHLENNTPLDGDVDIQRFDGKFDYTG